MIAGRSQKGKIVIVYRCDRCEREVEKAEFFAVEVTLNGKHAKKELCKTCLEKAENDLRKAGFELKEREGSNTVTSGTLFVNTMLMPRP